MRVGERVRDSARDEHERAGRVVVRAVADREGDRAVDHVEGLVEGLVSMRWRAGPLGRELGLEGDEVRALAGIDLHRDAGPESASLAGRERARGHVAPPALTHYIIGVVT